jgi:hypothetical protein
MDNLSTNRILQFLISFLAVFISYLRFKFKFKYKPISERKEQVFTKSDEYNFSTNSNCNDTIDNFKPNRNKLIIKQGGRRKLGEIRRTAAHAFIDDLNTKEIRNDVLIYDEEKFTDELFLNTQKTVRNLDAKKYDKKFAKSKKYNEEFRKMTRFKYTIKKLGDEVKFNKKIRLRFDREKTKVKMESDNFNKFIVNTHAWRSNGFRNVRKWQESLWDYFGWWGKTKFDLWEKPIPSFCSNQQ